MAFDSCKGVIGRWLIYETLPRYVPPRVTFRYGNEPWQVISPAEDYSITPIYDPTKYYWVTYASYQYNGICDFSSNNSIIQNTRFCKGDFRLEIALDEYYLYYGYSIRTYRLWQGEGFGYTNQVAAPNGDTYWIYQGCRNWDSGYFYNANSNSAPWLVSVVPIDHTINYKFIVYHNGYPVYQEVRNIQPEVEILPETCEYYPEDKRYVREFYNTSQYGWMSQLIQGNQVWVFANIPHGFPDPVIIPNTLYYKVSDCDLPPKIDTECIPDCVKCPEGTCPVPCGQVICCYNTEGFPIETIPIDRFCNHE